MQIHSAPFGNRVASLEKICLFPSYSPPYLYPISSMSCSSAHHSSLLSSFVVLIITIFHYPRSNFHATTTCTVTYDTHTHARILSIAYFILIRYAIQFRRCFFISIFFFFFYLFLDSIGKRGNDVVVWPVGNTIAPD